MPAAQRHRREAKRVGLSVACDRGGDRAHRRGRASCAKFASARQGGRVRGELGRAALHVDVATVEHQRDQGDQPENAESEDHENLGRCPPSGASMHGLLHSMYARAVVVSAGSGAIPALAAMDSTPSKSGLNTNVYVKATWT